VKSSLKLRPTLAVETHDLAVDDGVVDVDQLRQVAGERAETGEDVAVARDERRLALLEVEQCAPAVVLQLEKPVGMVEWLADTSRWERGEARAHSADATRKRSRVTSANGPAFVMPAELSRLPADAPKAAAQRYGLFLTCERSASASTVRPEARHDAACVAGVGEQWTAGLVPCFFLLQTPRLPRRQPAFGSSRAT